MEPATSLGRISERHEEMRSAFARHQHALVEHEFGEAIERLARYEALVSDHIREEEVHLLPPYALLGGAPGGAAGAFEAEHRKLQTMLDAIRRKVVALRDDPSPEAVVALIEREWSYKNLFEHHCLREEHVLFPTLDARLSEETRMRILDAMSGAAMAAHQEGT